MATFEGLAGIQTLFVPSGTFVNAVVARARQVGSNRRRITSRALGKRNYARK
jgi:hypothetical protein